MMSVKRSQPHRVPSLCSACPSAAAWHTEEERRCALPRCRRFSQSSLCNRDQVDSQCSSFVGMWHFSMRHTCCANNCSKHLLATPRRRSPPSWVLPQHHWFWEPKKKSAAVHKTSVPLAFFNYRIYFSQRRNTRRVYH